MACGLTEKKKAAKSKQKTETDSSVSLEGHERPMSQPVPSPAFRRPIPQHSPFFSIYLNPSSRTPLKERALVFFTAMFHPPHHLESSLLCTDLNLAVKEWEMDWWRVGWGIEEDGVVGKNSASLL